MKKETKGYKVYDPIFECVHITRDVVFEDNDKYNCSNFKKRRI